MPCVFAQGIGTPWSTIAGSSLDQISLADFDTHFVIPLLSRHGRKVPFTISLGGDPQQMEQYTYNGQTYWSLQSFGATYGVGGIDIGYSETGGSCEWETGHYLYYTVYSNFSYTDAEGAIHYFQAAPFDDDTGQKCHAA